MNYKTPECEAQLKQSPQKLQDIAKMLESISNFFGITATVTRVWDAVCGDSGVHEAKRAVDFRNETVDRHGESNFLYSPEQVDTIVNTINERYPRNDGKLVCLHHSFRGAPHHFHCQIPAHWA